jgi:hypothetical protein
MARLRVVGERRIYDGGAVVLNLVLHLLWRPALPFPLFRRHRPDSDLD